MKLFVDDIRNPPDDSWTVARTAGSAIRALAMFNFKEISLDHDISHQVVVGSLSRPFPCEETFQSVAHYIAARYELETAKGTLVPEWRPKITLHTANATGAEEMAAILSAAGLTPEIKLTGAANRLEMEV